MARPVCILTARRRLGGQLLLRLHSLTLGSLQRVFANSHCLLISTSSRTKPVLSFKHSLKMTGCICEARQVEDNEEGKIKGDRYPKLERTLRVGFMAGLMIRSLRLTGDGISPKMSRLKMSACLFACLPGCWWSCSPPFYVQSLWLPQRPTILPFLVQWFIIKRID